MVKVELPKTSWVLLLIVLEHDLFFDNPAITSLRKEIEDQIDSQEY